MDKLFCKKCSKEVTFLIEKKSNNNVAYCTVCGCFIKNVPNSNIGVTNTEHVFPFGKYKGVKVKDCTDEYYLRWCLAKFTKMNDDFMDCIYNRLQAIK